MDEEYNCLRCGKGIAALDNKFASYCANCKKELTMGGLI